MDARRMRRDGVHRQEWLRNPGTGEELGDTRMVRRAPHFDVASPCVHPEDWAFF